MVDFHEKHDGGEWFYLGNSRLIDGKKSLLSYSPTGCCILESQAPLQFISYLKLLPRLPWPPWPLTILLLMPKTNGRTESMI
jgi:hypothetical protein